MDRVVDYLTKKGHIRRTTRVSVFLDAKVMNAIYSRGELVGYRVSSNGFWSVVPADSVRVLTESLGSAIMVGQGRRLCHLARKCAGETKLDSRVGIQQER